MSAVATTVADDLSNMRDDDELGSIVSATIDALFDIQNELVKYIKDIPECCNVNYVDFATFRDVIRVRIEQPRFDDPYRWSLALASLIVHNNWHRDRRLLCEIIITVFTCRYMSNSRAIPLNRAVFETAISALGIDGSDIDIDAILKSY